MKKIILALTISLLATASVSAQAFQFDEETHDYGKLEEGPQATTIFKFKNTGDAPLVINSARGSCGCTQPEFPKEPIAPGATGEIKVTYNTQGRPGPFTKTVFINSNAKLTDGQVEKTIIIKGEVTPKPLEVVQQPAPPVNLNAGPKVEVGKDNTTSLKTEPAKTRTKKAKKKKQVHTADGQNK